MALWLVHCSCPTCSGTERAAAQGPPAHIRPTKPSMGCLLSHTKSLLKPCLAGHHRPCPTPSAGCCLSASCFSITWAKAASLMSTGSGLVHFICEARLTPNLVKMELITCRGDWTREQELHPWKGMMKPGSTYFVFHFNVVLFYLIHILHRASCLISKP